MQVASHCSALQQYYLSVEINVETSHILVRLARLGYQVYFALIVHSSLILTSNCDRSNDYGNFLSEGSYAYVLLVKT